MNAFPSKSRAFPRRRQAIDLPQTRMGYAKYKEDIEKIRSQNIFGTFLDRIGEPVPHHSCPFCSFEIHSKDLIETHILKEHRDAAIFLEHDDRIVPDRAVFKVRPVHLK